MIQVACRPVVFLFNEAQRYFDRGRTIQPRPQGFSLKRPLRRGCAFLKAIATCKRTLVSSFTLQNGSALQAMIQVQGKPVSV